VNMLFILNDPPYGTERVYNGLRLALGLLKSDAQTARDCVSHGRRGRRCQGRPEDAGRVLQRRADAEDRSTMDELAAATLESEKIGVLSMRLVYLDCNASSRSIRWSAPRGGHFLRITTAIQREQVPFSGIARRTKAETQQAQGICRHEHGRAGISKDRHP
jgi:uncharacterized protein involved in oxidation of intracellular sulfur